MERRIKLTDIDRPDEPLDVEIERMTETTLRVLVPNTVVGFELRRPHEGAAFEGALGGRYFTFDPPAEPPVEPPAPPKAGRRRK